MSNLSTFCDKEHFDACFRWSDGRRRPGAAPSSWTILNVANIKKPVAIDNLKSGTLYAFQLQALGMKGLSAWSDSSTIMCP